MTRKARIVVSAMAAGALVALLVGGFVAALRRSKTTGATSEASLSRWVPEPKATVGASPVLAPSGEADSQASVAARGLPSPVEQPVEEVLAELGEDTGAVYYMSRVREAIREGNPAFGRELLRQMKEQHPSSVLIGEAEAVCARGEVRS
jgi:hypothetical protein